ncbi:MAG: HAMP domain-containing sensor histidine kinase [Silicimonas sp.]|uniref:sensor histidine kinase n=1 Tax=Roseovarius sp. TaxID=1486281 RepID=UPI0032EC3A36
MIARPETRIGANLLLLRAASRIFRHDEEVRVRLKQTESLKAKLGIGAALLGGVTLVLAAILYLGMTRVADRLEAALATETRIARYSTLSREASTFIVIATETVQTERPPEVRADRLEPVSAAIARTFTLLRSDLEKAVEEARALGLDAQSRQATQSLGLARMEALLENTLRALRGPERDRDRLRAYIDSFASGFDPLLNQAVNTEIILRNEVLAGIERLRARLSRIAIATGIVSLLLVAGFYLLLIRPQFRRLDRLRRAAREIGQENFAVALPGGGRDEIGLLYAETDRMARALAERRDAVQAEWDRLNETIAQRTEALRAANTRLEEIDENRRRFFADISHELRTPLTVILMEAQIGRQGGEGAAQAFATIEARAARLNRRIDDLLRVARSETGQLALDPVVVPLERIAAEAVEEVQAEIDTAGLSLEVAEIPAVSVTCDPNWARQVIVGLVRNAIAHAREGGALRLAAEVDAQGAGLSLTDNGPGIAPDAQARVFERFEQAGRGRGQGFGIGLALAKWVVEAQGGQIALLSPVPREAAIGDAPGTKISVRLPRGTG